MTPVLTTEENGFYLSEGIEPIVIYSELVLGNPLNFKRVVATSCTRRRLRRQKRFPESDMIISYYEEIQRDYGSGDVLTLPAVDPAIFYPPATG